MTYFAGPICTGTGCTAFSLAIAAQFILGFVLGLVLIGVGVKYGRQGLKKNNGAAAGISLLLILIGLPLAGWTLIEMIDFVLRHYFNAYS